MNKATLLSEIQSDSSKHISFLQKFLQAPSPNPPGDTRQAAKVIQDFLKETSGIDAETVAPKAHMPNLVHDFDGGTNSPSSRQHPRLIFNGHIDVFPSGPEADWTPGRGPWSGFIDETEKRIYGRGASDMKCGTAALIIAYSYLFKYREHLTGSIGLTCTSDEETGGKWGAKYLVSSEKEGGGGFGDRWTGDVMLNAEPSGVGTIRFGEKGTLRLTFAVRTAGAHGAYLHRSASATIVASEVILELRKLVDSIEPAIDPKLKAYMSQPEVVSTVERAIGKGASDIILKPTINIGTLNGGLKVNMIPASCVFEADVRLPIGLKGETVLEKIDSEVLPKYQSSEPLIEVSYEVQQAASGSPGIPSPHDHPIVEIMARNAKDLVAGLKGGKAVAIPSLGASDCKFWRRNGVPTYYYGVDAKGMGQANESASLVEFLDVVKVHTTAAWEFLGGP